MLINWTFWPKKFFHIRSVFIRFEWQKIKNKNKKATYNFPFDIEMLRVQMSKFNFFFNRQKKYVSHFSSSFYHLDKDIPFHFWLSPNSFWWPNSNSIFVPLACSLLRSKRIPYICLMSASSFIGFVLKRDYTRRIL